MPYMAIRIFVRARVTCAIGIGGAWRMARETNGVITGHFVSKIEIHLFSLTWPRVE